MKVNGKNYRTVWLEGNIVKFINQSLLPHKFEIAESKNYDEAANAIKEMTIRGAPAIGAMAAYGMALAVLNLKDFNQLQKEIGNAEKLLKSSRPTAHDLFHAVDFMKNEILKAKSLEKAKKIAVEKSNEYADKNAEECRKIGINGEKLIKDNDKILVHCNAGALATVDYGTAISPIRFAHYNKKNIFVYVDETRPSFQGAKLTAWELLNEKIPHAVIVDNAAGYFMEKGEINLAIVGADRIAANGDIANKIGTYEKAVLAKENNIPFYVAAPLSTFDLKCENGSKIPIEERNEEEVLFAGKTRIAPEQSRAKNPVFDITPAKYITGIITEKGIIKADRSSIIALFGN